MKSMMDSVVVKRAWEMAAHHHREQKRKYSGLPYMVHCEAVASWCNLVTSDDRVVAAALLHDVLEDTDCPRGEILTKCGGRVLALVEEVTDVSRPEDGNRAHRKRLDRKHIARASVDGQTIKLADVIDNTLSISAHDVNFARVYLAEIEELMPLLNRGDEMLRAIASDVLVAAQTALVRHKTKEDL